MKSVTVKELKKLVETDTDVKLVDIRENYEFEDGHIEDSKNIPMDDLAQNPELISENSILICQSGRRAESLCFILDRNHNRSDVKFLEGGIVAYNEQ